MKFSELDKKMRVYEESIDQYIFPEMYIVARLDGRRMGIILLLRKQFS